MMQRPSLLVLCFVAVFDSPRGTYAWSPTKDACMTPMSKRGGGALTAVSVRKQTQPRNAPHHCILSTSTASGIGSREECHNCVHGSRQTFQDKVGKQLESSRDGNKGGALQLTTPFVFPVLVATIFVAEPAQAATTAASPVPSAFAAYGHYFGLLVMTASLVVERLTIKPGMSEDDETRLLLADTSYGAAALLVLYTGYLRVTQFGKGWEYYCHEPIFWLKMSLFAILGASSLFNTYKIIQREFMSGAVDEQMTDKLADRMVKIINAELLAMASIPLFATLMARGVGYNDSIPWEIGAAVTAALFIGLGGKYLIEAVTWKED